MHLIAFPTFKYQNKVLRTVTAKLFISNSQTILFPYRSLFVAFQVELEMRYILIIVVREITYALHLQFKVVVKY